MTKINVKICHIHGLDASQTSMLPKIIYIFNSASTSNFQQHFSEKQKNKPKFIWKHKTHKVAKTVLRKKTKLEK
jgi:hypothetical protein